MWGWEGARRGPTNDDEGFFVLRISNVLGRGCGAGRGPTNDKEGFFVFANFKCFHQESGIK